MDIIRLLILHDKSITRTFRTPFSFLVSARQKVVRSIYEGRPLVIGLPDSPDEN
ncbi:MAG: hypothetical protein V3U94_05710 [Candidatus Thorarchaeota archaeon]